ncbi:MAG TPA: inositol monophosphatase family protein [Methylomirabilota bacterium]|jgi:histidinol-phosphatase|nr:inositol monophosphatase family protein [Methylomirabilota bacterium]
MDRVLTLMVEAARAGGAVALAHFRRGVEVTLKSDRSPVTAADREAEETIIALLRRSFPDHGFLGEELGAGGPSGRRFIIDPIDGTRNFVRRIPYWATLIALEEDGEVTAAVVLQPATGDLHVARKGRGAFLNGEAIRVSAVSALGDGTLVHPTLTLLRDAAHWDGFVRLVDATGRQRGFGDYLCYTVIAEGRAEVGIGLGVKVWDLAPLKLLVEEAGGRFTDFDGRPSITSGVALASNGLLHDAALALLRGR